jgi:hypothetical protein
MRRSTLLALTAGVGAALATGVVVALTVGYGTTVGPNRVVNAAQPLDANNSPTVVRNPRQPDNLVVVHRVDKPEFSARLEFSLDGGSSWAPRMLPLPAGRAKPFAPDAAFGPDGTLFVSYVDLEGVGNTPANLWLSTSADGGRTLSEPVRVAGRLTFQPRVAVDRDGVVYITWLRAADVGLFRLLGGPNPVVVSRSTDGGQTFSDPVPVSDPGRERVGAASPVIDSRGNLVVLYQDFRGDRRDFENLEGPPAEEPFALVVTRSDDGGRTFSPGVEVDFDLVPSGRFVVFLPPFPSLAAGPDDALFVTWADARNGDDDVFLRRSTDGGATWSPAVRVNDNRPGDGTSQYLPRVSVSAGGRVDVVFLDRRRDPRNVAADAWLASSSDSGRSFDNLRLSSRSFDSRVGNRTPRGGPDFGSRLGVDSHETTTIAVWTDTRVGNPGTGRQDIAAAQVKRSPRWPLFVAPLAAGSVVVLGLLWLSRPRTET